MLHYLHMYVLILDHHDHLHMILYLHHIIFLFDYVLYRDLLNDHPSMAIYNPYNIILTYLLMSYLLANVNLVHTEIHTYYSLMQDLIHHLDILLLYLQHLSILSQRLHYSMFSRFLLLHIELTVLYLLLTVYMIIPHSLYSLHMVRPSLHIIYFSSLELLHYYHKLLYILLIDPTSQISVILNSLYILPNIHSTTIPFNMYPLHILLSFLALQNLLIIVILPMRLLILLHLYLFTVILLHSDRMHLMYLMHYLLLHF